MSLFPAHLRLKSAFQRLRRDERANVSMIFAFSVPVLVLAMAVGVDFTNAAVTRSRLADAADAAALAALTPAMMQQVDSVAQTAAYAMFDGRVQTVSAVTPGTVQRNISVATNSTTGMRVAQVTYSANVNALFGGVLSLFGALPPNTGMKVGGGATAQASEPPNINFYLLLDNSPSMSLPASTAGINTMISLTPTQDNGHTCAFACHQASTNNTDTQGNLCTDGTTPQFPQCNSNGTVKQNNQYCSMDSSCSTTVQNQYQNYTQKAQMDNFALARANNITLRLDELTNGVTTLMSTAKQYQTTINPSNPPVYQFAAYSMDTLWSVPSSNNLLMNLTTDYQNAWTTAKANFGVMQMFSNSYGCASANCTGGSYNNDQTTNYDTAMSSINSAMPNPGNGTQSSSAQEILFFVTDGVEDENFNGSRLIQTINANGATNWCTTIKNRGIKIAVLYTDYLPVTTNGFYNGNVAPFQPTISAALQACASTGLFYDASAGTDLGKALSTLFATAMQQSAALSN